MEYARAFERDIGYSTSFKNYSITTNWNHELTDAIENLASILYLFYFLYTPYYY
jgi:hypothetical protein